MWIPAVTVAAGLLTSLTTLSDGAVPTPNEMGKSVAPLVEAVKDAVVTIQSMKTVARAQRSDALTDFLRERMGLGAAPRMREEIERGLGSGFIIDGKGVILTNNHVVAGADEIQVVTSDGRTLAATVVGSDPGTDVAVVQLTKPPSGLKVSRLGNSDKLRVGDYVLAIGNPLGLGQTVTMGIVSAKNRSLDGQLTNYADFIQTDAAINQGNSGGPLFNFNGDVVGINSAILNPARAMNVGFAIPINLAKGIADQIRRSGRVGRGFLGVTSAPFTQEQAQRLGMEFEPGALINGVGRSSPAEAGGLRTNDVIVEVAGHRIDSGRALTLLVQSRPPGETVPMVVLRGKQRITLQVKLTENVDLRREDVLGMSVQRLSEQDGAALGLQNGQGLRVVGVDPRGSVSGSLQEGDVIVMISSPLRRPASVETLRAFAEAVKRGAHGQLVILRDGEPFALSF